jgi:hypothetical protein
LAFSFSCHLTVSIKAFSTALLVVTNKTKKSRHVGGNAPAFLIGEKRLRA